jgi:hypothetical protein
MTGDTNGDGSVNILDAVIIGAMWGIQRGEQTFRKSAIKTNVSHNSE